MNKIILSLLLLMSFGPLSLKSQCDAKRLLDSSAVGIPKEFVFTKARYINITGPADKSKAIYPVTLNKGTTYVITLIEPKKNQNDGKMVVNLLDPQDRFIATNYNFKNKKYYNKIVFNCNATGKYYLAYLFDGGEGKGCGGSAMGFAKTKL